MAPLPTQWNNDFQLYPPSLYRVDLFRLLNYFIPSISSRPFRRQTQCPYCDGTNEQWKFHLLFGGVRCSTNQMFSFFHSWSIWKNTIRVLEAHLLPYLINLHIHIALFAPDGSTVIGYQLKMYLKSYGTEKKIKLVCFAKLPQLKKFEFQTNIFKGIVHTKIKSYHSWI